MQTFRRVGTYKSHVCPATKVLDRFNCIDGEDRVHGPDKTFSDPLPSWFHIYTDGSGGVVAPRKPLKMLVGEWQCSQNKTLVCTQSGERLFTDQLM